MTNFMIFKFLVGFVLTFIANIALADVPSNYITGKSVINPTYGAVGPIKGEIRYDPTTGTPIVRKTSYSELTPVSNYSLVVYSRYSPTNTTGEYLLVHGDNSTSVHVFRVSDNQKIATLTYDTNPIHTVGEVNEVRWDYSKLYPTRVYFVLGMKFYQMDVLTGNGNPTLIRDFSVDYPGAAKIINDVEGDSSTDSRYWAWQVLDPYINGSYPVRTFIVYDKQSNSIIGTLNPSDVNHTGYLPKPNMIEISPLGTKVITHYGEASTRPSTLNGVWINVGNGVWELSGYKSSTAGNNVFSLVTADGVPLSKTIEGSGAATNIVSDYQYACNSTSDKFWVRLSGIADPNTQTIIADWGIRPVDVGTFIDAPHSWDLNFTNPIKISVGETHSGWAFDAEGNEWFVSQNNRTDWIEARSIANGQAINILYHGDLGWSNGFHFGKFYDVSQRGWFMMSTYSSINSEWGNNQLMLVELAPSTQNPQIWRVTPSYNNYQGNYRDEGSAALGFDGKSLWVTANWGVPSGHGEVYNFLFPDSWYEHFPGTLHPDTTPPKLTINQVSSPTYTTSQAISGTVIENAALVSVTVKVGSGAYFPATVIGSTWNFALSDLIVGTNNVTVTAQDAAGNLSDLSFAVVVDQIPPVVSSFIVPPTSTSLVVTGLVLNVSDDNAVTGYLITENNISPTASEVNLYPAPNSFTAASAGSKTLYAWARDGAGNVSAVFEGQSCTIDITAPVINSFSAQAISVSLTVNGINLTASDDIGVTGYLITENNTPPVASAVNLTPAPISYTATTAGAKTLYAWARDAAGNVSSVFTGQPCVVDPTAPVINSFTVPASSTSLTVSGIALTASDNIAVTGYLITENSTPPAASAVNLTPAPISYTSATAGSKTLYAWARDAAGNVSALFTGQPCVIDTAKPTISTFTVPAYSPSAIISGISVTAADNIAVTGYLITESATPPAANVVTVFPAPNSYTTSGTGAKTLYAWARDAAGNVSVLFTGRSVIVDTIRPTIDSFSVPATSTSLTISGISITATDANGVTGYLITESSTSPAAGAVILTPAPTSYVASTAGTKTLYAWARDEAGNVSLVYTARTCSIDTSKPTISTFAVPAFSASLTISGISLSAADNIGVTGYLITESTSPPAASTILLASAPTSYTAASAGSKTLYAWSRDAAGNVSALFAGKTCLVDMTKPTVNSFTVPASSTSLTVSGIVVSASDNTGVTGYLITESSTSPAASAVNLSQPPTSYVATSSGSKTLYAWARDAAGNVSLSRSAVVTINPVVGSYPSLQNAYNTVPSGGLLFIGEGTLTETFTANRNVTVTVEGGYNADFSDNPGFTVINGKVTVQAGRIIFENIKVR